MNRIITSDITAVSQMPWKYPSLDFIQDAYTNKLVSLGKTMVLGRFATYSSTTPYILEGVTFSVSGLTNSCTSGTILYADNIYSVPAHTFGVTGSTIYGYTSSSYDVVADPTTFSDLTLHNIHQITEIKFAQAGSTASVYSFGASASMRITPGIQWELLAPYLIGGDVIASTISIPYVGLGPSGKIHFKGQIIANTSVSTGDSFIRLPSAYIPTVSRFSTLIYYNETTPVLYNSLSKLIDGIEYGGLYPGQVLFYEPAPAGGILYLETMSFFI